MGRGCFAVYLLVGLCVASGSGLRVCVDPPPASYTTGDMPVDVVVAFPSPTFSVLGFRSASSRVTSLRGDNFSYFVLPPTHHAPSFDAGIIIASRTPILRGEHVSVSTGTPLQMIYDTSAVRAEFAGGTVLWVLREDAGMDALKIVNKKRAATDNVLVGRSGVLKFHSKNSNYTHAIGHGEVGVVY